MHVKILVFIMLLLFSGKILAINTDNSIIKIHITKKIQSYYMPWSNHGLHRDQHLAVAIKKGSEIVFVTQAYPLQQAKAIEGETFKNSRVYSLDIFAIDFDANIAIIKPKDALKNNDFTEDIEPLPIDVNFKLGDETKLVISNDEGTKLVKIRSESAKMVNYPLSSIDNLAIEFEKVGRLLHKSEPIISNKGIVGIIAKTSENKPFAINPISLQKFITMDHKKSPKTIAYLGFKAKSFSDPYLRHHIGDQAGGAGVRITKVDTGSSFSQELKRNDILIKIGPYDISDQGYIQHPQFGKIPFEGFLSELQEGDELTLSIRREKAVKTITKKILPFQSNHFVIPFREESFDYEIFCGLIFQELSLPLLQSFGHLWAKKAPISFLILWNFLNDYQKSDAVRHRVILSRVLQDEVNHGYESLNNIFLEKFNNKEIFSLSNLREAIKNPININNSQFHELKFEKSIAAIFFSKDAHDQSISRIRQEYGVTSP